AAPAFMTLTDAILKERTRWISLARRLDSAYRRSGRTITEGDPVAVAIRQLSDGQELDKTLLEQLAAHQLVASATLPPGGFAQEGFIREVTGQYGHIIALQSSRAASGVALTRDCLTVQDELRKLLGKLEGYKAAKSQFATIENWTTW